MGKEKKIAEKREVIVSVMANLPKSNEVSNINVWRSLTGIAHSKGLCIWCMKSEDNHHKDSKTYNLHLLNQLGINNCISLS